MNYSALALEDLLRTCVEGGQALAWEEFIRRFNPLVSRVALRTARRWGDCSRPLLEDLKIGSDWSRVVIGGSSPRTSLSPSTSKPWATGDRATDKLTAKSCEVAHCPHFSVLVKLMADRAVSRRRESIGSTTVNPRMLSPKHVQIFDWKINLNFSLELPLEKQRCRHRLQFLHHRCRRKTRNAV
jgi:hypothetical protein